MYKILYANIPTYDKYHTAIEKFTSFPIKFCKRIDQKMHNIN